MAENLVIGDRVRLISGGPVMTVHEIEPDDHVVIVWFTPDMHLQTDTLRIACLDMVEGFFTLPTGAA